MGICIQEKRVNPVRRVSICSCEALFLRAPPSTPASSAQLRPWRLSWLPPGSVFNPRKGRPGYPSSPTTAPPLGCRNLLQPGITKSTGLPSASQRKLSLLEKALCISMSAEEERTMADLCRASSEMLRMR